MEKLIPKNSMYLKLLNGGIVKAQTGWTAYLNPKNWGVSSYDYDENNNLRTFKQAFRAARSKGSKEFLYKGKRYNTTLASTAPKKNYNQGIYMTRFPAKADHKMFAEVMTPIFKEVFEEYSIPLGHLNNVVRQAGLESGYGSDPRGSKGYNLGGIKWMKGTRGEKYNKSLREGTDNEWYIDFDNLHDYAEYKVWLLNNTYDAFKAKNTADFSNRLHGNNPEGKHYSANSKGYLETLTNTPTLDQYLNPEYDLK